MAGELGPPLGQQREWRGPAHSEARRAGQLSGVLLDPRVPEASLPVHLRAARLLVGVGGGGAVLPDSELEECLWVFLCVKEKEI